MNFLSYQNVVLVCRDLETKNYAYRCVVSKTADLTTAELRCSMLKETGIITTVISTEYLIDALKYYFTILKLNQCQYENN